MLDELERACPRCGQRRDPTRAPGEVTRIVLETPPPPPVAPLAASGTRTFEFLEHPEVGYAQVMAGPQPLRADVDLAELIGLSHARIGVQYENYRSGKEFALGRVGTENPALVSFDLLMVTLRTGF